MTIPLPCLVWIVYNASTNVELATLSNVSHSWREIVVQCIIRAVGEGEEEEEEEEEEGRRQRQIEEETYCVAWFHPDGIKFKQLPILEDDNNNDTPNFGERNQNTGGSMGYVNAVLTGAPKQYTSSPSISVDVAHNLQNKDKIVVESCCYRRFKAFWIHPIPPYENPTKRTQGRFPTSDIATSSSNVERKDRDDGRDTCIPLSLTYSTCLLSQRSGTGHSSFAVRGTTVARPEGYCQCWDEDDTSTDFLSANYNISRMKKNRRRRELQREIIETDSLPSLQTGGILRPCIQFLNIDSSHAVRLFTPPFEKLETTPLTVFCVAIATEDGCFFSGLKKKMEMGHICGDISEDRSPICLNADYIDQRKGGNKENYSSMCSMSSGVCNYHDCHQRNSDHNSDNYSGSDHEEDVDDTKEVCDNIIRGQLGPGMWHCYVVVFDGEKSVIRIDGVEESLTYDSIISPSFSACLDGITIGSDHVFDMSLCFGQGSDGEGEGAISELAFFKGKLELIDILKLERHLMDKFGITMPVKPKSERTIEDSNSRLAHSLMDQSPSCVSRSNNDDIIRGVPLRHMTMLREVAWKQTNPVTGESIRVQRIGNKFRDGSSSEW
ncbi:hypothetical protein FRACYDRAFT_234372 [Fragilariopsis cylindrus CCMP1102]|uniref:Uncharacterized protein n=1 Tax=Fragilariopsis cylindrus CCMP1102 TaxID=635003 RepID=A0A1E7FRE8_9STRA|nr:hypothetical protein FRACYDRAFT_234372 [Fragilariopsis cylindrus CCMP1102]|eukprot:OEU20741.1 hypothetical protein FRACYDRAFT_234372 [Fragilariopsis cylindrus CCMP1102]